MPLEKKVQVLEGLKLAVGTKRAIFCWARFHHLYPEKHGSCLEYIHMHPSQPDAFIRYTRRENQVWGRYAHMYAHTIQQLAYAAKEQIR